jgi:IclR family transcriptional regulator, acetate operon repressor
MTVDPVKEPDSVRAVDRALAVLEAFTPEAPRLSALELQARTGLSRPTLYRLLQSLGARGLVQAEGEPRRFTLGPSVMRLAQVWLSALDIRRLAQPLLEELRDATGETAALFLLRDDKRICVAEAVSRHVLAMSRGIGETEHISRGASGRAILAYAQPGQDWRRAAMASLPPEADPAALEAELAEVRRRGYALSRGEVFRGALAIAAPVFDHAGVVIGSVALFGPEARLPPAEAEAAGKRLIRTAGSLSRQLGFMPPG